MRSVLVLLFLVSVLAQKSCVSFVKDKVVVGPCEGSGYTASGSFKDEIETTGWARLHIETKNDHPDSVQAYSAGYLEGYLTTERIFQYITNMYGGKTGYSEKLRTFVEENLAWMKQEIVAKADDPQWHQIGLMFRQFDGLYDGYAHKAPKDQQFPKDVFYAVQLAGDLDDLCPAFGCVGRQSYRMKQIGNSHCSVLIKVLANFTDIITGHTTWSKYETMTRIYKLYDFAYRIAPSDHHIVPGKSIFFSSYPGTLLSVDDYYQVKSGLVVTETTLTNHNKELWKNVKSQGQVPNWARTMVANRLATNGEEWMKIYFKYNSGTYNNQWMVLDYNRFQPGKALRPGTLWVGEQLPGYHVTEDMTAHLSSTTHWVSYNRPFFPFIFNISGQPELVAQFGDHYSWSKTARAVLFGELHPSVVDEKSYEKVIRWNNFKHDAISVQGCKEGRSGSNAISERGDLTLLASLCIPDITQIDEGGIDAKYTNYKMMMEHKEDMIVVTQSGPTHDTQPPFVWSKSPFAHISHIGQPDNYAFPWIVLSSEVV